MLKKYNKKYIVFLLEKINYLLLYIESLLDIGCAAGGLGNSLKSLLKDKLDYTGIDINPESIKIGKKLFHNLNLI